MLFETPDNPIPDNADPGVFTARDGAKLRYARFGSTGGAPRGTVVVLTGRGECIEKYFETIRDLARTGLDVVALDWRGQGGSDRVHRNRERGHVRSFQAYVADLDKFFDDIVLPDCRSPFFVLGHSTGGLIALLAAPTLVNRVERMVICAPLLTLPKSPLSMRGVGRLASLFYYLGLGPMYVSGGSWAPVPFEHNKVTSDPRRYARNIAIYQAFPQLGLGGPTVAWIRAAALASETVQEADFVAKIRIPILCIVAGADRVVSTAATERYIRRLRSGSILTIDGAQHEILQEADRYREPFLAAFRAFIPGTED